MLLLQAMSMPGASSNPLRRVSRTADTDLQTVFCFNVDPTGKHTNINVLRARTSNCVQTLLHTFELQRTRARLCFSAHAEGTVAAAHFSNFCHFFFLFFFNVRQFHLRPSRAIARGSDRQAQTSRDASSQLFFAFQLSHCFHDYIAPRRTPPHLNALTAFALF